MIRALPERLHSVPVRFGSAAVVAVLAAVAWPSTGSGSSRTAVLQYDRGEGAEACPDEHTARAGIAARLGYDPFVEDSDRRIHVRLRSKSSGPGYTARIETRTGESSDPGVRTLETSDADCQRLARTLLFTVGVMIDPGGAGRARPGRSPDRGRTAVMAAIVRAHDAASRAAARQSRAGAPAEQQESPSEIPESSEEPVRKPVDVRADLGAGLAAGTAPHPTGLLRIGVELAKPRWAVRLSGRAELPATREVSGGTLTTSLLLGALDVCGRLAPAFACGSAALGRLRLTGSEFDDSNSTGELYAAGGAGAGTDISLGERFALRLQGRLYATFIQTHATVDDEPVWTTPVLSGALAGSLLVDF